MSRRAVTALWFVVAALMTGVAATQAQDERTVTALLFAISAAFALLTAVLRWRSAR